MNSFKNISLSGANSELVCWNCKGSLSVGPIVYNSIYGNICGRKICANLASTEGSNSKQVLYERVAQFLKFPCAYRNGGCLSELKWDNVKTHEDACYFRKIQCPFYYKHFECYEKCEWSGEHFEILSHVRNRHPENEFRNPRVIDDLEEANVRIFFTNVRSTIIFVSLLIDHKKQLFCKLWTTEVLRPVLKYRIKFFDITYAKSIPTSTQEVEILRRRSLEQDIIENCATIDLNTMKILLDNLCYMTIEFFLNNNPVEIQRSSSAPSIPLPGFCGAALKKKCDFCQGELAPPTFSCVNGHIVCFRCVLQDICPICSGTASQNKCFDRLKVFLDEPCANYKRGCTFVAPYLCTRDHERNCEYSSKFCVKCEIPISGIFTHVVEQHSQDFIRLQELYKLHWNPSSRSEYFIIFDHQVFYFSVMRNGKGGLFYKILCLETKRIKYRHEIHFVDNKVSGARLMLSNVCYPGGVDMRKYDIGRNITYSTEIHQDIIKQLFPLPGDIEFKLSITKISPDELESTEENDDNFL